MPKRKEKLKAKEKIKQMKEERKQKPEPKEEVVMSISTSLQRDSLGKKDVTRPKLLREANTLKT